MKEQPDNAVFDCKVLSRAHAELWYDGETVRALDCDSRNACLQFFIRDTKSSNGTFVNNMRLPAKSGEDSAPQQIYSGDIIQLGVEIVDGQKKVWLALSLIAKRKEVVLQQFGCVVAMARIFDSAGNEVTRPSDQYA